MFHRKALLQFEEKMLKLEHEDVVRRGATKEVPKPRNPNAINK